jgi:hypothetical protein
MNFFLLFLLALSFSSQAFILTAQCSFNNQVGICHVVNNTGELIFCNLEASGKTSRGARGRFYERGFLPSGSSMSVYVYANNPQLDPLIEVGGFAKCTSR